MANPDDDLTWGRSTVETVCSLDCPDTCSLEVTLEKGRIVAIDGSDKHAVTDGYICGKVRRFGERVYGDTRLRHPLVREGARGQGRFRRASWDEALGTIATRMIEIRDRWGAEAILPFSYGGSNGLLTQDTVDARLFRQFGTSRLARTVCAIPTSTANQALYLFEHDLADQQFLAEHTHGAEQLRERAAPWTFDRAAEVAGLDPELLENFAEMYADISPAVLRCGWGLERNRNGGNAALAVLALPTVAGKFGVRGGGYSMSNSGAWNLSPDTWIDTPEPDTRIVNMNLLGKALLEYHDPPIQMLFVYNCNPVATMPNQNRVLKGLAREDLFTVVFEQVMTDTAQLADVVLPATTFLESYDVAKSYGLPNLQLVRPVIDAVEEARPNVEVFAELATRLGLDAGRDQATDAEALLHLASVLPDEIRQPLMDTGSVVGVADGTPIQFVDVFPRTPDGKVQLFPEELERESPAGLYRYREDPATSDYPLTLISPATEKTICSTLGELRTRVASLQMHPDDADARELSTGDTARMFNALGEVHCSVTRNADMRRGTVGLPKGLWRMSTFNGSTANALVSDDLTDIGGGAVFNDARVEVARVMRASFDKQNLALWTTDPVKPVH